MTALKGFFDFSRNESLSLKGFACLGVVLCHVFPSVNTNCGFLFVSLFFFLSGNGFRLRGSPLSFPYAFQKVFPLLFGFAVVSLPSFFFGGFSWIPPAWFMLPYALIVFGLCFLPSSVVFFLVGLFCLWGSSSAFTWGASWIFFFFGFWIGNFSFDRFLLFFGIVFLSFVFNPVLPFFWLLAFFFICFSVFFRRLFKPFFSVGRFSPLIYVVHCLPLALCGINPWLKGGIFLYFN